MGSEMCIRDRAAAVDPLSCRRPREIADGGDRVADDADVALAAPCLLYTSDAADERSSVDLGGRRIIKKKKDRHRAGRRDRTCDSNDNE